jgi:lipoprotein NlpD
MTKSLVFWGATLPLVLLLSACASPLNRAPIEDRVRGGNASAPATAPAPAPGEPNKNFPGWENAGKPGFHTVRQGDTVLRIALESGQNWRDIVRWNNLDNPNVIELGQVLRVAPPAEATAATPAAPAPGAAAVKPVTPPPKVDAKPLEPGKPATAPASAPAAAPSNSPGPVPAPAPTPGAATADDDVTWGWPAPRSNIVAPFDDPRVKGLVFSGKAGDPVLAAADGKVMYVGNGLRGWGNLVLVQHNKSYITAYAHNQTIHVKEDQTVKRGQRIAEMGSSDAERVQLHFEIRRLGKPLDPSRLLPPR